MAFTGKKGTGSSIQTIVGVIIILLVIAVIIITMYGGKDGFLSKIGSIAESVADKVYKGSKTDAPPPENQQLNTVTAYSEFDKLVTTFSSLPPNEKCVHTFFGHGKFEDGNSIYLLSSKDSEGKPKMVIRFMNSKGQIETQREFPGLQPCVVALGTAATNFYANWLKSSTVCSGTGCKTPEYTVTDIMIADDGDLVVQGKEVNWAEDSDRFIMYKPTKDMLCFVPTKYYWVPGRCTTTSDDEFLSNACPDNILDNPSLRQCSTFGTISRTSGASGGW